MARTESPWFRKTRPASCRKRKPDRPRLVSPANDWACERSGPRPSGSASLVFGVQRQEDTNQCSASLRLDMAVDSDLPAVSFDELLRDEESNPCTDRSPLGEESVEDLRQYIRFDAYAVICNSEDDSLCRSPGVANRNRQSAPVGHGIDRVC